jgi:hypothetical protein
MIVWSSMIDSLGVETKAGPPAALARGVPVKGLGSANRAIVSTRAKRVRKDRETKVFNT